MRNAFITRLGAGLALAAALSTTTALVSCARGPDLPEGLYARLGTSRGQILVKLAYEEAPLTVGNFVGLAEGKLDATKGSRFYDGLTFHRVVPDFVVQGGDPKGDGSGGPGYRFPDEFAPGLKHDGPGVLSMANAGPGTNGSQFFITLKATPWLDGMHSIFGKVVEGMDAVNAVVQGDKLDKIEILRVGAKAKAFKSDQAAWNERASVAVAAAKKAIDDKRAADLALVAQKYPDLSADADGIFQKVLKRGSGPTPTAGQTISVSYAGSLLDGTVFDRSDLHGGSFDFQVGAGRVIPGWDKVLLTMNKGEKRLVVLPPEMAYGERGTPGGPIGQYAFLVFEVELLAIKQ